MYGTFQTKTITGQMALLSPHPMALWIKKVMQGQENAIFRQTVANFQQCQSEDYGCSKDQICQLL